MFLIVFCASVFHCILFLALILCPQDFKNTGMVSTVVSLTSCGEGASLALVDHLSGDSVTMKMPYGVDVLHRPASHPIFSYWVG